MTEKDAVKYQHLIKDNAAYHERFWVVPLEILDTPELRRLESFMIERLDEMRKK